MAPRLQNRLFTTGQSPADVLGIPEEELPEELLTNPAWAAEYHRLKGTPATRSDDSLKVTSQRPADIVAAGVPTGQIPEELLTDPRWAASYHQAAGTRPTPSQGPGGGGGNGSSAPSQLAALILQAQGGGRPFPQSFYQRLADTGEKPFPPSFYQRLAQPSAQEKLQEFQQRLPLWGDMSPEEFARRYEAGQPLQVEMGEPYLPVSVEMGRPTLDRRAMDFAQGSQDLLRRRPTVRTGPTAPITAPGQYESLARYAPGQESERQAALRYAAGRGANGSSPPAQMASLAMGGAAPEAEALTPVQQALKWAAQRYMLAQAARIGGTAIGRGDAPGYAALERAAGEPVAALQMEQAEEDRAAGLRRQQAMMDPTSPESRAVQKLLGTVPGLKDVAGEVPAGQAELALKAAEARQKGMPSADAAERLALQREGLELRRQLGGAQLEESRARRAENESFRQALFGQREEKMAREAGERAVPGYVFAPGQFPSAQSAERMRDALSRVNQIQNSLGSMRDIWKRSGAELGWGAERATSQSDRQDILLNLKELQNLGVLQKVDVDTLEKVIPDPNTLRGAILPGEVEAKFDTFERQLRSTIATRAAARGYVPAGGGAAPPAPGGGGGQVERRRLPDGRVLERGPDGKVRVIGG